MDGRRLLDGVSSLWTNVHGHCHPALDAALHDQLARVAHTTMLGLSHRPAIELASALVTATQSTLGLERVFYSDNGSTAVEVALKMAFQYHQQTGNPERVRFATLSDAYHGDTIGAVSVGGIDLFHQIYRPLLFGAVVLPAPRDPGATEESDCLSRALALLERHGHELAAIVVEPLVQGAAGMKMHTRAYLEPILRRAHELGVLVIADEVAVGFGRLGTLFAMEQVGVKPDLLCLAKGIAAGYLPLAATLSTERIYSAFLGAPEQYRQFFHGHTFTGNPLACAVALESLELFGRDGVLENVARVERQLSVLLGELANDPWVRQIRHRGVMVGIDLGADDGASFDPTRRIGHRVAMACREFGAIVRPLGDTIVLNPPLVIRPAECDALIGATRSAIQSVRDSA